MTNRAGFFWASSLILACFPTSTVAQVEILDVGPGQREVTGSVISAETHQPVPSAVILISDSAGDVQLTTLSGVDGGFSFLPPEAGSYSIQVTSIGYGSVEGAVRVSAEGRIRLRVLMDVDPVELDQIEARARPHRITTDMTFEGFDARKVSERGVFFDEEEIARRKPSRITDLVARSSGFRILRSRGRQVDVESIRAIGNPFHRGNCLPDIWLDGLRVRVGGYKEEGPGLLYLNDVINPENLGGVEVYVGLSQIPIQFRGTNSVCGAVILWTKRAWVDRFEPPPLCR